MHPYSALVLGIGAPVQVAPRISVSWPSLILSCFVIELKITGSGVVRTIPGGTERGSERRALPRTAGSLAASRHLKGVVRVAAGDVARVVGVRESVVKEIHRGDSCGVAWILLFGIFKTKQVSLKYLCKVGWSCIGIWYQLGIPLQLKSHFILFYERLDHVGRFCAPAFKISLKIYTQKNKLAKTRKIWKIFSNLFW